jgi:hypothetical protein
MFFDAEISWFGQGGPPLTANRKKIHQLSISFSSDVQIFNLISS